MTNSVLTCNIYELHAQLFCIACSCLLLGGANDNTIAILTCSLVSISCNKLKQSTSIATIARINTDTSSIPVPTSVVPVF